MLFEYAVQPQVLGSDWRLCKYFIEKFGFDRGRLIADFPNRTWLRAVYDVSGGQSDMDRKRIAELLARAKRSLVRSNRAYDPKAGDWLANALAQEAIDPFHAIIADQNPGGSPNVLIAHDVDETTPLFESSHCWQVQRTAPALGAAMRPLLCNANEIWFVDPFFSVLERPYIETLETCLQIAAASGNAGANVQIHDREHDKRPPIADVERRVPKALAGVIPKGMRISIHGWRERPGGEDFHARYLLTNRGGLSVESGFSAEGAHQNVDVHLLTPTICQAKKDALTLGAAYQADGPVLEIDSDCKVVRL